MSTIRAIFPPDSGPPRRYATGRWILYSYCSLPDDDDYTASDNTSGDDKLRVVLSARKVRDPVAYRAPFDRDIGHPVPLCAV